MGVLVCLLLNDINILFFGVNSKCSAEELVKQELQSVAEGVAASVFQSPSNSESSAHEKMESSYKSNQGGEVQSSDVELQHKAKLEVHNLLLR